MVVFGCFIIDTFGLKFVTLKFKYFVSNVFILSKEQLHCYINQQLKLLPHKLNL